MDGLGCACRRAVSRVPRSLVAHSPPALGRSRLPCRERGGFPVYIRADVERVAREKAGSHASSGTGAGQPAAAAPASGRAGRAAQRQAAAAKPGASGDAAGAAEPSSAAPAGQGGKAKRGRFGPVAAAQHAAAKRGKQQGSSDGEGS